VRAAVSCIALVSCTCGGSSADPIDAPPAAIDVSTTDAPAPDADVSGCPTFAGTDAGPPRTIRLVYEVEGDEPTGASDTAGAVSLFRDGSDIVIFGNYAFFRFDADGNLLDKVTYQRVPGAVGPCIAAAQMASGYGALFIAGGGLIDFCPVSLAGAVDVPACFRLPFAQRRPAIVASADTYVVLTSNSFVAHARRFDQVGTLVEETDLWSDEGGGIGHAATAALDETFLVCGGGHHAASPYCDTTWAHVIPATLDQMGIWAADLLPDAFDHEMRCTAAASEDRFAIIASGHCYREYMGDYCSYRPMSEPNATLLTMLAPDGTVLVDKRELPLPAGSPTNIAWDGSGYVTLTDTFPALLVGKLSANGGSFTGPLEVPVTLGVPNFELVAYSSRVFPLAPDDYLIAYATQYVGTSTQFRLARVVLE
jgi:hypothetical protein